MKTKNYYLRGLLTLTLGAFTVSSYAQLYSPSGMVDGVTPGGVTVGATPAQTNYELTVGGQSYFRALNTAERDIVLEGTNPRMRINAIDGTTQLDLIRESESHGTYIRFRSNSGATQYQLGQANNPSATSDNWKISAGSIFNNTNPALAINRDNNVGIGIDQPIAKLDVRGDNIFLSDIANNNGLPSRFISLGNSGGACDSYGMRVQLDPNRFANFGIQKINGVIDNPFIGYGGKNTIFRFRYDDNGEPNCGTEIMAVTNPTSSFQLVLYGTGYASGGTWVASDRRLKSNIVEVDGSMSKLMQLNPVSYTFNQDAAPNKLLPDGTHYGVLAQELQKVVPEAVKDDGEGFLAVNYEMLIPLLIDGVQEQQDEMEALYERIRVLEGQLEKSTTSKDEAISSEIEVSTLMQNTPNPFTQMTTIGYELPQTATGATVYVYDMQGKVIRSYENLPGGKGQVQIDGGDLEAGMYLYTLIANGKEIDTKRMILTK